MGTVGDAYDSALAESFRATLQNRAPGWAGLENSIAGEISSL